LNKKNLFNKVLRPYIRFYLLFYKINVKIVVRFYAYHRIKPHVPPLV